MDLTDKQWKVLGPLLPKPKIRKDGRGRRWRDPRDVLNGILWILRSGARWKDMPERYPSYQTCHRRFQFWVRSGVMEKILEYLITDLRDRGKVNRRPSPHFKLLWIWYDPTPIWWTRSLCGKSQN